jgi:hypothetical protein
VADRLCGAGPVKPGRSFGRGRGFEVPRLARRRAVLPFGGKTVVFTLRDRRSLRATQPGSQPLLPVCRPQLTLSGRSPARRLAPAVAIHPCQISLAIFLRPASLPLARRVSLCVISFGFGEVSGGAS